MGVKGIDIQITANGAAAEAALLRVNEHLKGTGTAGKEAADQISGAMDKLQSALGMVGLTVGLGEAINMMKEAVTSSLEFGEAIERASQKTGLAAGTLSTLHYAAAVTGGDFDSMTSAVAKMDKSIGQATEGNKPALAFMKSLGLNAKDLAGRSDGAEIAFHKFATTLAATENPIRRVELATALLGKAGAAQIPMLLDIGNNWDEYKQKAMDAGVYLDGAGAASLEETNRRFKEMGQKIDGAKLAVADGFTPALEALFNTMSGGKSSVQFMEDFGDVMGRNLAFAAGSAFSLASGLVRIAEIGDGGTLTNAGRQMSELAQTLASQSDQMFAEAFKTVDGVKTSRILQGVGATGIVGMGGVATGDETSGKGRKGGFKGLDDGTDGTDGGRGGGRTRTARADAVEGTPLDPGMKAQLAIRAEQARRAREQMRAQETIQNEAPPPINMTDNGAAMAAGEKLRVQTEALQALDIKGDIIKRESGLTETQIQQQALTGTMTQQAALEQLNSEHAAEIVRLQALAAEYAQFGDAGRDAYVKIEEEITRTMEETKKQDKKGEDPAVKALGDGITSMAEKMAQATGKGRQGFHAMAMSMEQDLVELAVKFAAQKWLAPFMNSLGAGMSGGGGGFNPGGAGNGAANIAAFAGGGDFPGGSPIMVGEKGPELAFPSGPGTIMPNDALQNLSRTSGGGGAPNMTMNVTNASSQPVTARQTGSSFDADSKSWMTHVILEDLSQGGPISSALRPGG